MSGTAADERTGERPPCAFIMAEANAERLRGALTLARCEIALGGSARFFLQGRAVSLLHRPVSAIDDAAWIGAGEPGLGALLDEALADGVAVTLCQSALAMLGVPADAYDPRLEIGGLVGFLAATPPDARLFFA